MPPNGRISTRATETLRETVMLAALAVSSLGLLELAVTLNASRTAVERDRYVFMVIP